MNNFSNLKAKKSLGQNFLKSKNAIFAMIKAGDVSENDIVLEAGPGKGVLTEELLKKAGKVIAVEKDDMLVEFLRDKFKLEIESGKLELVHGDILEFNPATYHLPPTTYNLPLTTYNLQTYRQHPLSHHRPIFKKISVRRHSAFQNGDSPSKRSDGKNYGE